MTELKRNTIVHFLIFPLLICIIQCNDFDANYFEIQCYHLTLYILIFFDVKNDFLVMVVFFAGDLMTQ